MNIDELLDRYFEGETSAEEEREIRVFFSSGSVPEHLAAYKPLFAYFDEEIRKVGRQEKKRPLTHKTVWFIMTGVAATFLLLLGISRLLYPADPCFCSENYVVINGRCYTDIHTVRTFAFEALQEVATPASDYFPEEDNDVADRNLLENQLKELGSLFSEDE